MPRVGHGVVQVTGWWVVVGVVRMRSDVCRDTGKTADPVKRISQDNSGSHAASRWSGGCHVDVCARLPCGRSNERSCKHRVLFGDDTAT